MKRLLLFSATGVALVTLGIWAALGANTGWTKNRVQEMHTDEITGIEHAVWTDRWVPGIDFVAVGLACSSGLLIASFVIRRRKP
ncbi:MAG TPA: hypothetical protein VMM36_04500 [Opitutaceae bacterium]|nr:hypothetical protein [Opitutaceae bacterium]